MYRLQVCLFVAILILSSSVIPLTYGQITTIPSPMKQLRLGISPSDIQCKKGFQLMVRNENGNPICVSQETESKLFARGWGIMPLRGLPVRPQIQNETRSTSTLIKSAYDNTVVNSSKIQSDCSKGRKAYPDGYGLSELMIFPKMSSSSGNLQILCILMSPSNPKVGDTLTVGLLITNISDRLLWFITGACASPLHFTITPKDIGQYILCPNGIKSAVGFGPMQPNEIGVVVAYGEYQIIRSGTLTINMDLQYSVTKGPAPDLNNTTTSDFLNKTHTNLYKWGTTEAHDALQFNVNATQ